MGEASFPPLREKGKIDASVRFMDVARVCKSGRKENLERSLCVCGFHMQFLTCFCSSLYFLFIDQLGFLGAWESRSAI